jgi:hypothetical protein
MGMRSINSQYSPVVIRKGVIIELIKLTNNSMMMLERY